jgi:CelD/BcsL family acetyltransferase involved in cellulose biosynthesis
MALEITIARTANELARLRSRWESLCAAEQSTIFQDFDWNMLAVTTFAEREPPRIVCAEASYGLAIVPAVIRQSDASLRLAGEELFDYRCFLHEGDDAVLACALAELAAWQRPLEVIGLRDQDRKSVLNGLRSSSFSGAPRIDRSSLSAEEFGARHSRLGRNLRRLERQGFAIRAYSGENSPLVSLIYERKAAQDPCSLFHDPLRIEFLVKAALLQPLAFEIFILERGSSMAAAVVTLRDGDVRRFYTGWFAPEFERLSPAMALIYEITRQALAAGLDCDYMTGEQPYKMRLATSCVPLYRLRASPHELAAIASIWLPSSIG